MTSSVPAIVVNGLCKTYREGILFPKRLQALNDVSLEVSQGEIFGLLGPNGAGKTTLLKILLGIIGKSSGMASMLGLPAGSRRARAHVGFLPEHLRIPSHLTAYAALEVYGNLHNLANRTIRQRRDRLLELVGLRGRERDRVKKFSKGMLQRLGLAQALLNEPKLLILDEPTDGLDPRARAEMRTLIRRLRDEGVTVFLNSHLLQEVELVCDRIAILDRGHLRASGRIGEITAMLDGQQAQANVQWLLSGDRQRLAAIFTSQQLAESASATGAHLSLSESLASQAAIDARIDQLRSAGISILQMTRQRASLEEAFLALVAPTATSSDSAAAPSSPEVR